MSDAPADQPVRCSGRGCRAPATVALVWRNPRIHGDGGGGRVKRWLACPDHEAGLTDFLARRGFLLRTEPLP